MHLCLEGLVLSLNQSNMLVNVYIFHKLGWATNLCSPIKKGCVAISSNPPLYISTFTHWQQIIGTSH